MSCPDSYRPFKPFDEAPTPDAERNLQDALPSDEDIRGLTSALVASGGGSASEDIALDLVLNQIVEQACLATGATGAAIALTRNGEMVCRATTGRTAPDLGVRLDNAGFSAECLRVGTLQRCDDTETDPRVDTAACRLLGVRSILVVPLWYWGEFMGILEIFSPRPNAFGERDEQTLQAFAYRIVRHTKQASGHLAGFSTRVEDSSARETAPTPSPTINLKPPVLPQPMPELVREHLRTPIFELKPKRIKAAREPHDRWTYWLAMCAALIACLIVSLMIWRVGWPRTSAQRSAHSAQTAPQAQELDLTPAAEAAQPAAAQQADTPKPATLKRPSTAPQAQASGTAAGVVVSAASKKDVQPPAPASPDLTTTPAVPTAGDRPPATGGLAIYDAKGKLIYGTPIHPDQPGKAASKPKASSSPKSTLAAKSVSPDSPTLIDGRFVRLKPEVAESLLDQRVEPDYPDAARRAHIQGSVTLETLIGANGKVQQATPVGGNPQLAEAAAAAVRQWRYKPFTVDGRQVPIRTQVTVSFMLAQ